MTESFYPKTNTSISLQEFIDFIDNNPMIHALKCSEYKPKYFNAIAKKFAQLAHNKKFLTDQLSAELKSFENFQLDNQFKPSTIIIHKGNGYTVRAVIWMPVSKRYPPEIFSYFEPHDHNFDFFTLNYFGPGYRTRIYNYDYGLVKGIPGEEISLRFVEENSLTKGKVMYYYSNSDAHIQYPPESLTVTLNLILPKIYPANRRQYEFELLEEKDKAKLIIGSLDRMSQLRTLIDTAINLENTSSTELIRKIAMTHANEQIRAIAWKALLSSKIPNPDDFILALQDDSEYVKAFLTDTDKTK